jgi:hypothetical protein
MIKYTKLQRDEEVPQRAKKDVDWLVKTQDQDGCWRKFCFPFTNSGDKTYSTHIAWRLFEAAKI